MTANPAGDRWLRAGAKPRGRIEPEPVTRDLTPGERASRAIRLAARRAARRSTDGIG